MHRMDLQLAQVWRLPDGVRVGTVDTFQGQETAVCLFSMATSSGEEIPRNLEFLFSGNRLSVAVSRARCLGVLVCGPALLNIRCRDAEQMRLLNGLCLLWRWLERRGDN
jgi:superfamily I DNA and/or RNA helicase